MFTLTQICISTPHHVIFSSFSSSVTHIWRTFAINYRKKKVEKQMNNVYIDSFKTFFKIGLFTFGGGYAMIPMIESEVVDKKKWVEKEEFLDMIAIAQSCPGVFAINASIFIGYKLRKTRGAICTSLGTALPSFLIILAIAMFFHQFKDNHVVASIFRGIRPAVVALIAVPTFKLGRSAQVTFTNCWIPVLTALLVWKMGISPILVVLLAGVGGYVYGKYIKPTE